MSGGKKEEEEDVHKRNRDFIALPSSSPVKNTCIDYVYIEMNQLIGIVFIGIGFFFYSEFSRKSKF